MIGKLIGAFAGSKLAQTSRGVGGPTGAVLGVGAAAIAKRLSLPVLIAVSAGGYFAKKYFDKQEANDNSTATAKLPQKTTTARTPAKTDGAAVTPAAPA